MLHDTPLITAISMGLVLAFLFGTLAQRFRLSPLVGYLLAGVVAGFINKSAININLDPLMVEQLAELGVVLLMFGVGLHFSTKDLMSVRKIAVPGAVVQIFLATVLGAALAYWGINWGIELYNKGVEPESVINFRYGIGGAIVFGLALSTASTVVLIRALEERAALVTERGKIAVGWLIVEDVACVLLLVILPILAPMMTGNPTTSIVGTGSIWFALLKTGALVVAFVVVMLTIGRKFIPWTLEKVAGLGSKELFTLSVLAIALGVALGAAYLFGVSLALGAFFAGMMLNESELSHEAAADSLPLRDAFAVLFFVSVGLQLDLQIFVQHPFLIILTVLIIVIGKSIGAYFLVRIFRYSKETALTVAISLAQIGEFAFIIVSLGYTLKLVDPIGKSLVLAAAILSIILNPFLFKLLDRWIEKNKELSTAEKEEIEESFAAIPTEEHTIIVGFGRVGNELCKIMKAKDTPFVVIETDSYIAEKAQKQGYPTIIGNAAAEDTFLKANPQTANEILIASVQPFESGVIVERISRLNPAAIIVARAETDAAVDYLLTQGAHGAVMEKKELAFSMAEMATAGKRLTQKGMWPPPREANLTTMTETAAESNDANPVTPEPTESKADETVEMTAPTNKENSTQDSAPVVEIVDENNEPISEDVEKNTTDDKN